ncbi:hypothetical protein ACWIUD_05270 [Helicobacter sp. 23-1044]
MQVQISLPYALCFVENGDDYGEFWSVSIFYRGGGICIFVLLKIFRNFSRIYKISPHFYAIFGAESSADFAIILLDSANVLSDSANFIILRLNKILRFAESRTKIAESKN